MSNKVMVTNLIGLNTVKPSDQPIILLPHYLRSSVEELARTGKIRLAYQIHDTTLTPQGQLVLNEALRNRRVLVAEPGTKMVHSHEDIKNWLQQLGFDVKIEGEMTILQRDILEDVVSQLQEQGWTVY